MLYLFDVLYAIFVDLPVEFLELKAEKIPGLNCPWRGIEPGDSVH